MQGEGRGGEGVVTVVVGKVMRVSASGYKVCIHFLRLTHLYCEVCTFVVTLKLMCLVAVFLVIKMYEPTHRNSRINLFIPNQVISEIETLAPEETAAEQAHA